MNQKRGSHAVLQTGSILPSVLTHCCCAAIGFGFWFRLERETLNETARKTPRFLPSSRAGAGIGEVIMRLAQTSFLLFVLPPEDEFGTTSKKADCRKGTHKSMAKLGIKPTPSPNSSHQTTFPSWRHSLTTYPGTLFEFESFPQCKASPSLWNSFPNSFYSTRF